MRIDTLEIAWFRGAADPVSLPIDGNSAVIYGANGSGKSSFVDAIEYAIAGRIDHLAHEYSGKRQEKGIGNTHTPAGRDSAIRITFSDKSEESVTIDRSGVAARTTSATAGISSWSLKRTVLRQDEVAAFIRDTKGAKYSALLPLLDLGPLEVAAENTRKLARAIDSKSRRNTLRSDLAAVAGLRQTHLPGMSDAQIRDELLGLYRKYTLEDAEGTSDADVCSELLGAIDRRVADSSRDQRRFIALSDVSRSTLATDIAAVRVATERLAGGVEPLLRERLDVLRAIGPFAGGIDPGEEVTCPACGQLIRSDDLKEHVNREQLRLQELIAESDKRRSAVTATIAALRTIRARLGEPDVAAWATAKAREALAESIRFIEDLNLEQLADRCDETALANIERSVLPLIVAAVEECKSAPADAAALAADRRIVEAAQNVLGSVAKRQQLERADALVAFVDTLEAEIRGEIKRKAAAVINEISGDVQANWAILHPEKRIEDVHLYVATDAAKGIDIGLKFHGVDQDSPRLTLSEGLRNGLGLCIFLAMAKREAESDRPIILDDVVVRLDRQHRGMVVQVLIKELAGRQVVLFTHDRDWYTELRPQLAKAGWAFKALLPYETPSTGIRWSRTASEFDDARAHLEHRPDSAGNDARKIMDTALAGVAEELKIRLPYMRAERNDQRTCQDFLPRLIADAKKCLQKQDGDAYAVDTDRIALLENAQVLLAAWANRASHGHDLVRPEAERLIDACEAALAAFGCQACGKDVWYADATKDESVQCRCGAVRWRYRTG